MGYLYGACFGVLLILCIEIPRYILFCRELDRRFDLEIKLRNQDREHRLRAAGISEEDIADLSERINTAWKQLI